MRNLIAGLAGGFLIASVCFRIMEIRWQDDLLTQHHRDMTELARKDAQNCIWSKR